MKLFEIDDIKGPEQDIDAQVPFDAAQPDGSMDSQPADDEQIDQLDQDVDATNSMVQRYVKGAHLVYKRPSDDGSFEELWVYPSVDVKTDLTVRKAILGGTDITPNMSKSEDGTQNCETWTAGNAQMLYITGLPN